MSTVSGAIKKFIVNKNSTVIEESDSVSLSSFKDQDIHSLPVSPVQPVEQATSSSTLCQQCHSGSERKNDSPNVNCIENCENLASWPKSLLTAQRDSHRERST